MIAPGVYPHLDNEDYHHNPECEGLSKGGADRILTTPAHMRVQLFIQNPPTPQMVFGSAFHTYILQPHLFEIECEVSQTKTVPAPKREAAAAEGISLITQTDFDAIQNMRDSILDSQTASGILAGAEFEHSIFWDDPVYNVRCKCKPDITRKDIKLLADLKSAISAHPEAFSRSIANFNYDLQAAHYLDGALHAHGIGFRHFVFIVVEKTPPFAVGIYRADPAMLENGHAKAQRAKVLYSQCIEDDKWPAYPDRIVDISIPGWAKLRG